MTKAYTFTTKHYPVNDLMALDLEDHLDQMAKAGWQLVSTQHLINELHGDSGWGRCFLRYFDPAILSLHDSEPIEACRKSPHLSGTVSGRRSISSQSCI